MDTVTVTRGSCRVIGCSPSPGSEVTKRLTLHFLEAWTVNIYLHPSGPDSVRKAPGSCTASQRRERTERRRGGQQKWECGECWPDPERRRKCCSCVFFQVEPPVALMTSQLCSLSAFSIPPSLSPRFPGKNLNTDALSRM